MYGLTQSDLHNIKDKLASQKDYLDNNFFTTQSGQVKSLHDVSFSANHSVRYYAQLSNKIDTMTTYARANELHACFLTMTLDGFYRDLLKGDYRRFDMLQGKELLNVLLSIPDNEHQGYIVTKIFNRERLTIKDLYNILNYQTSKFLKSYAFKKLKKSQRKYMYIRTVEPHKDGVPHFHTMLYIPGDMIQQFQKDFIKSYPAPRNRKKFSELSKNELKYFKRYNLDDLVSFQTDIQDTTAYIMKYIIKTFVNVKENKEVDYIQAWYVKHRIIRCVTSRSLVPQWVYQKAAVFEKDWFHLTDLMSDPVNIVEWNKEDDYFYFEDTRTQRELIYQHGVFEVVYGYRVIKSVGTVREKKFKVDIYEKVPKTFNNKNSKVLVYDDKDKQIGIYSHKKISLYKHYNPPGLMNDIDLYYYYNSLDIETVNLHHFGYVKNLMIERGFIHNVKVTIDEYLNYNF